MKTRGPHVRPQHQDDDAPDGAIGSVVGRRQDRPRGNPDPFLLDVGRAVIDDGAPITNIRRPPFLSRALSRISSLTEFVQPQRPAGRPGFEPRPALAEGRRPVPTVDVKDGASLAGNESAEASCTGSTARHGACSSTSSNHRRAVDRSPWPVNAHQTSLPPRPAKNEPLKPRRRKPSSANAPPPTPTSHRVIASSLVPSQPRRSQTLAPAAR